MSFIISQQVLSLYFSLILSDIYNIIDLMY